MLVMGKIYLIFGWFFAYWNTGSRAYGKFVYAVAVE